MFDKFGEFDSVEELNKAADGFLAEGDTASILALAKENGIEEEDARDFIDGMNEEFATLPLAAMGKIEIEQKEKCSDDSEKMAMRVIFAMINVLIMESEIQKGILKKGKRAKDILKGLREGASNHKKGNMGVSCGTDKELRDIIRAYYTETNKEFKAKIEDLYK